MKLLITGSSSGIGRSIALLFLKKGFNVIGMDLKDSSIKHSSYIHYKLNIFKDELPSISDINILINNASLFEGCDLIDNNLKGSIKVSEKYALNNKTLTSVLFLGSASVYNGAEFPNYVASKGGVLAYMKNLAKRVSPLATCNCLSPGGVITESNKHILDSPKLYEEVKGETLLNKWASEDEIAEFAYFITVINKSMTGMDVIVDNGELIKSNFVW